MKLLVVLPFHEGDHRQLLRLLEWIQELGGCPENDCLIVCGKDTNPTLIESVSKLALQSFHLVTLHKTPHRLPDEAWPKGPNWLFETAARKIESDKLGPWLWLEPDATPLCLKWLDYLERGYAREGKPFMGPKLDPTDVVPGLAGVSVYPENTWTLLGPSLTNRAVAFDVAAGKITADNGKITRLMTHYWGQSKFPPVFVAQKVYGSPKHAMLLESIPKLSVLFHRCKDGSLIDLLKAPGASLELTVVITSYQRPRHLILAFNSCIRARVKNIIVAATGDLKPMRNALDAIKRTKPDVVVFEDSQATSNQSWLQGVEAAQTKYVTLLHDDDLLLAEYLDLVEPGLTANAPFIMVQASNHGVPNYIEKDSVRDGFESSSVLRPRLDKKGNLAISPLRGVFRKDDLVQWLRECESMPPNCYLRPGFLVGNDLAIWLKATGKYSEFFNVPKPAVSFGHWEGSTTVDSLGKNDRKLFSIYDETRRWISKSPIHFLTIVLDGMPFIEKHLAVFDQLKIPWEWHIVEGAASNTHCTKWCKPQTARLSKDGTTEYLDLISSHPKVHIYRKTLWDGKVEMVNDPLNAIKEECVLLEVDCDEFWTTEQLEAMVGLFAGDRTKTHAMFWCRYFFGPHLVMESRNCYANNPHQDWKRAWRFKPGDRFLSHEPPQLSSEKIAFSHAETEAKGLVFDHHGYAIRKQVEYKEAFYGYKGAVQHWDKLQQMKTGQAKLSDYLPWVRPEQSGIVKVI